MPQFNHLKTYLPQVRSSYNRIARIIQAIISSHVDNDGRIDDFTSLSRDLERYGVNLNKWANEFWRQILERQSKGLKNDWAKSGIKVNNQSPQMQFAIVQLQAQAVNEIKTLPLNAAKVAQDLSRRAALETGDRAESLIAQLQGLKPGYPEYAAKRLARTEIARSQSLLVQKQAEDVGVTHYIWRTAEDSDVRDAHADLDGKVFAFNDPPYIEGEGYHGPGQSFNCRCWSEPIITVKNQ